MRRGSGRLLPLVLTCIVASACVGTPQPPPAAEPTPDFLTAIALSVLSDAVYLVDPETAERSVLADDLADFQAGFASWSPDHRLVAYGDGGIVIVSPRTGRIRDLVRKSSLSMPTWSPDGERLAYGDGLNLWVTPYAYLQATYLELPLELAPLAMAWHPGGRIAFQGLEMKCRVPQGCSSTNRSDIWTVNENGSGLLRVTSFDTAVSPKWSADGRRILFVRQAPDSSAGELWAAAADGSRMERLGTAEDVLAADWSPDGKRLALVRPSDRPGALQLWVGDARGRDLRPLGDPVPGDHATVDW